MPIIASITFEISEFFGVNNPFNLALILRLLTGMLAIIVMTRWQKMLDDPLQKSLSFFTATLFCFMPYICVRFSSETWSGIFLFLAWIYSNKASTNRQYFILGCIIGISFLLRFQMIIMIFIWAIHMILTNHKKYQQILFYCLGVVFISMVGIILDSWFYGEFTFSFWNYCMAFLYPKNPSAFDANSWHFFLDYFTHIHAFIIAPILVIAATFFLIKNKKSIISWWLFGFIAFHQIIHHKEFRFLIPLAFFIPVILSPSIQFIQKNWKLKKIKLAFFILLAINLYAIPFFCFRPAGIGRISVIEWINNHHLNQHLKITCSPYANPLNPWGGYGNSFYQFEDAQIINIANVADWTPSKSADTTEILIIRNQEWKNTTVKNQLQKMSFSPVFNSIPLWVMSANRHLNWFDNNETLIILKRQ